MAMEQDGVSKSRYFTSEVMFCKYLAGFPLLHATGSEYCIVAE